MDENFLKFKKKVWLHILIKCVAAGLAAGLITVLAVLLPCKLCGVELFWLFYVLIALGGLALGGGVAFLCLRTNDKKIAKLLDCELQLSERVQTSLAYGGCSGEMYEMQRADTAAALKSKPVKSLPFKNLVATVLCGCVFLAGLVAVPVVATTVPPVFAQQEEKPPVDPPRDITDWEWAALDELIDYVRNSKKADNDFKLSVVGRLQGLKTLLLNGVSQNNLADFVQNTVTNIRNDVKDINEKNPSNAENNSEEEAYVVAKLYEIFSLQQKPEEGDPDDPPEEKPDDGKGEDGKTPGSVNVNKMPFFDPEKGEVLCGEVRSEYYEKVQKALQEGTISREEWEYIMITYFGDLSGNQE